MWALLAHCLAGVGCLRRCRILARVGLRLAVVLQRHAVSSIVLRRACLLQ